MPETDAYNDDALYSDLDECGAAVPGSGDDDPYYCEDTYATDSAAADIPIGSTVLCAPAEDLPF